MDSHRCKCWSFSIHMCVVLNPKQCLFHLETVFVQWISHWFKLTLHSSTPSRWKDQKTRSWFGKSQMILCWSHWKYVNRTFITSNWLCRTCIHELAWNVVCIREIKPFVACDSLFSLSKIFLPHFFIRKMKDEKRNNRINPVLEAKLNEKWFVICQNSLALQNNPAQRHKKFSTNRIQQRLKLRESEPTKTKQRVATANEQHQQCRQTFWEFKIVPYTKSNKWMLS